MVQVWIFVGELLTKERVFLSTLKGRPDGWGTPFTYVYESMVFSWCSTLGILGDEKTRKYPRDISKAYIGISHRGTLVGVHPTIP